MEAKCFVNVFVRFAADKTRNHGVTVMIRARSAGVEAQACAVKGAG